MRWTALAAAALVAAVMGVLCWPRTVGTVTPGRGTPGGSRQEEDTPELQGRVEHLLAAPEARRAARDPGDPVASGGETGSVADLLLVGATVERDTYELGEPVRIRRVFENPTERTITVDAAGWRQRVHGEVVLKFAHGSRGYEPATDQVPGVVVAPHGRIANDIEIELPSAGAWTIEIPPAYQASPPQRRSFHLDVTVLDRGEAGHLAKKAERLARTIQTEDPTCPTCWSEAQKELEALGPAAIPNMRRWLAGADSPHLRAVSAKILGPMVSRGTEGREELLGGLSDSDPQVRKMCAAALAAPATVETLTALLPMMRDQDVWVRIEAIQAVAKSDDARVIPALILSLDDEDAYVRQWAATTLAEKGNAKGIRILVRALEADPAQNGFLVVEALDKLTGFSFGQAEMPFLHSIQDRVDEAIATNQKLAKRWLEWWDKEGARHYGD